MNDQGLINSSVYTYNQFEYNFAGSLTSNINENNIDENSNGKIEGIEFVFTINATKTGVFYIEFPLYAPFLSNFYLFIGYFSSETNISSVGLNNISVVISSFDLIGSGFPGPYKIIDIYLIFEDDILQDVINLDYTTVISSFEHLEKEAYILNLNDEFLDRNSNEISDGIVITFDVFSELNAEFIIEYSIKGGNGFGMYDWILVQYSEIVNFAYQNDNNYFISIRIYGIDLLSILVESTDLVVNINGRDISNYQTKDVMEYHTEYIDLDYIEVYIPPKTPINIISVSDILIDSTGDGYFDSININAEINFTRPAAAIIYFEITNEDLGISLRQPRVIYTAGKKMVSISKTFSLISWINELKNSNIVFRINVSVIEYSNNIAYKLDEFSYSSNTFDSNVWTTYNIDPTDNTPPSLKINLKDGIILNGEIKIEISSNDVVTGFLKIGSEYKKDFAFTNKTSFSLDTTTIENGKYILSIELMDINQNKAGLSINIEINNAEESGTGISGFGIISFFLIFVILAPLYRNKKN